MAFKHTSEMTQMYVMVIWKNGEEGRNDGLSEPESYFLQLNLCEIVDSNVIKGT